LPDVSPKDVHGFMAFQIGKQIDAALAGLGRVGVEIRYYFDRGGTAWSSLLPDVSYTSFARFPSNDANDDAAQRPRIAPDIAAEVLSPGDRPSRTKRKVEAYLEYGAAVVLVVNPEQRRVAVHRADGTVEERDAVGTMAVPPFDGLVLDWDVIYRNSGL
jgi:Uma2 family endonuclease